METISMESQPQNPEFRLNPENQCTYHDWACGSGCMHPDQHETRSENIGTHLLKSLHAG